MNMIKVEIEIDELCEIIGSMYLVYSQTSDDDEDIKYYRKRILVKLSKKLKSCGYSTKTSGTILSEMG